MPEVNPMKDVAETIAKKSFEKTETCSLPEEVGGFIKQLTWCERSRSSELANFWDKYDLNPPKQSDWRGVPFKLDQHSSPESIAKWVNDGGNHVRGRDINCADCARSFELSWRGEPTVSCYNYRDSSKCGDFNVVQKWCGADLKPQSYSDIARQLKEGGHGSSAYIAVWWKGGGGHAFNAVNDHGTLKLIDTQAKGGVVREFPPSSSLVKGYAHGENYVTQSRAVIWRGEHK